MANFRDPAFLKRLPAEITASETLVDSIGIVLERVVGWRQFFWVGVFTIDGGAAKRLDFRGPLPSSSGQIGTGFTETKASLAVPIQGPGKRQIGLLQVETDEPGGFSLEDKRVLGLVCDMLGPVLSRPGRPEPARYDL